MEDYWKSLVNGQYYKYSLLYMSFSLQTPTSNVLQGHEIVCYWCSVAYTDSFIVPLLLKHVAGKGVIAFFDRFDRRSR